MPILLLGSCGGLLPVSWRLSDPLLNRPFDPALPLHVLLVWPERVEIRRAEGLSEVSPRPVDATYQFMIPVDRRAWVESEVRRHPSPHPDAYWLLRVLEFGPDRQRLQLELFGDGIRGIVYEATDREIIPLHSRLTGAGFAYIVMKVNFWLWSALWVMIYIGIRVWRRRRLAPSEQLGEQGRNP